MVLINGGPALDRYGVSPHVGRLISPRSGNRLIPGQPWAGDNDAFKAWDEARFLRMLDRVSDLSTLDDCLFVAVPDVVADAQATLEKFWRWREEVTLRGLPVALVAQDGLESLDVPWPYFEAMFVGGSTEWKLSRSAADLVTEANARGKHTHMGRVNTRRRLRIAYDAGVRSVDGTGWSMFPDKYLRRDLPFIERLHRRPPRGWRGRLVQTALFGEEPTDA